MNLSRLITRALASWQLWRQHREIRRAIPKLRELDRLEAAYRAQHRRGSAKIARAKRDLIHAQLRGGRA